MSGVKMITIYVKYLFWTKRVADYQPETDSNFADIFSFRDRLLGTFRYPADLRTIRFGLVEYPWEVSTSLWHLLIMPFRQPRAPVEKETA